jgi:hypothetical protein
MAKRGRPHKPKGTGTVNISLRLPAELLERIRKAAKDTHGNTSREIANRLNASFAPKRAEDPAMRALCFLISQIAKATSPPAAGSDKSGVWRSNPFFFAAFKLAVGQLLEALTPPGEIVAPELPAAIAGLANTEVAFFPETYQSVEKLAQTAVGALFLFMEASPEQHAKTARLFGEKDWSYPNEYHWMPDAARDLTVNPELTGQWRPK